MARQPLSKHNDVVVGFAQDARQEVEASDKAKGKDKNSLELQPRAFKAQARELSPNVLVADKKRQGLLRQSRE